MAYTTPPTKTPPTPTLASDWNTYIRDNEITLRANALSGMGELIQTQTISAAASVTFSSLTTNYTHLGFVAYGLYADVASDLQIRFNADSGANYLYATLAYAAVTGDVSANSDTATSIIVPTFLSNSSANGGFIRGYITQYRSAANKKVYFTGFANSRIAVGGGSWQDTSAITSVRFLFGGNNGTGTFNVYGMND